MKETGESSWLRPGFERQILPMWQNTRDFTIAAVFPGLTADLLIHKSSSTFGGRGGGGKA